MRKKEIQGSRKEINPTLLEKEKIDNAFTKMMLGQKRIKEAYCSYEVSKLLKEKGFKESTQFVWYEHLPSPNATHNSEIGKPKRDYFYWEKEGERNSLWTNDSPIPSYINGEVYSCPTHQMACAWLRKKGIYIEISIAITTDDKVYYHANVGTISNAWKLVDEWNDSYENSVENALKYTLENLI